MQTRRHRLRRLEAGFECDADTCREDWVEKGSGVPGGIGGSFFRLASKSLLTQKPKDCARPLYFASGTRGVGLGSFER